MARLRRLIVAAAVGLLLALASAAPAAAAPERDPCANRLCTQDRPRARSCWKLFTRYRERSRCFITRAARHFGESRSLALAIAHRESRFQWWVVNRWGYAGLYQFGRRLWRTTPYRVQSRTHPRWASLAAMWVWSHGGYRHWSL